MSVKRIKGGRALQREDDEQTKEELDALHQKFFRVIAAQHDTALAMKPIGLLKGMIAKEVVVPKDKRQIKNAISKNRCVIRGGGSTFTASILPHANETIIHTANLDSIQIKKNIAVVGSGVPFYQLMNEAKKYNLEVPCYPHSFNSATIGGFIANNGVVGVNSAGCGYLQDYIDELEVITSSGTIFQIRGRDIIEFFGSEGNLGLITKVTMRLIEKETRFIHMYGFDGIEDVLKFLETGEKSIHISYFFNKPALKEFESEWQLKYVHPYTMIVIDKNSKNDYTKEIREDLTGRGVSYIYPKDILTWAFKRFSTLELSVTQKKKYVHIGDGIVIHDQIAKVMRIANRNKLPTFVNTGKNEFLFRTYMNAGTNLKKQKYMNIMNAMYSSSEPNCVGSFFRRQLSGTEREKRFKEAFGKYDSKINIVPRVQFAKSPVVKTIMSPLIHFFGGNMW